MHLILGDVGTWLMMREKSETRGSCDIDSWSSPHLFLDFDITLALNKVRMDKLGNLECVVLVE